MFSSLRVSDSVLDFERVLELEAHNSQAQAAKQRLPPLIEQQREKMKEEMFGLCLGVMVLVHLLLIMLW